MPTIRERTTADGKTRYLAQIQITAKGVRYRESDTFDKRVQAQKWGERREKEMRKAIAEGRDPTVQKVATVTLGDVIDRYVAESPKEIGSTKAQVLRTIRREYDIAGMPCQRIGSQQIVAFANEIADRPATPSTVHNYLSSLSAIFGIARPMWGYELDQQAMKDAMTVCKRMGITGKSKERDRRPTFDELDKLMTHFMAKHAARPDSAPMHKIIAFAIFSTRRQSEICRITWADYEPEHERVMVRDMKNPGDKEGNHQWVDLPNPCRAIIETMPKTSDRIFPHSADAVTAAFTRACQALAIEDLHFHDLRHEGTSRLAEMGYSLPLMLAVTGHRSFDSVKRYTHVRKAGDKYEGWHWLDKVT